MLRHRQGLTCSEAHPHLSSFTSTTVYTPPIVYTHHPPSLQSSNPLLPEAFILHNSSLRPLALLARGFLQQLRAFTTLHRLFTVLWVARSERNKIVNSEKYPKRHLATADLVVSACISASVQVEYSCFHIKLGKQVGTGRPQPLFASNNYRTSHPNINNSDGCGGKQESSSVLPNHVSAPYATPPSSSSISLSK